MVATKMHHTEPRGFTQINQTLEPEEIYRF